MTKMLRRVALLTMLFLLPVAQQAQAQGTVTVANGSSTNSYVPVYGGWMDAAQHNQIIYPASMLTDLVGHNLIGMTFYLSSPASGVWNAPVIIRMTIVSDSVLSSVIEDPDSLVTVAQVAVNGTAATLPIAFSTAYTYNGGHLLVDIQTQASSYSSSTFYGESQVYASSYYSYNSNAYTQQFIPKTSFDWSDGEFCNAPYDLTVSDITTTTAVFSWTPGGSETSWEVSIDGTSQVVYDTFVELEDLTRSSQHTASVRALCGDDLMSSTITTTFLTECGLITSPFFEGFESGTSNQPFRCWNILTNDFNYPRTYNYNVYEGGKALYFSIATGSNYTGPENIVQLPQTTFPLNQIHISYALRVSYGSTFELGYLTFNDSNNYEFHTITRHEGLAPQYSVFDFYTDTLPEMDSTILAFRFSFGDQSSNTYDYAYLDNVLIEPSTDCRRPVYTHLFRTEWNNAVIDWRPFAYSPDNQYEVRFGIDPDVNSLNNITLDVTSDTFMTIENLLPETQYYAWVRLDCGGGEYSSWSEVIPFTTTYACAPVQDIYLEGVGYHHLALSWSTSNIGLSPDQFIVQYRKVGTSTWTYDTVSTRYYYLDGLDTMATYEIYVTTACDTFLSSQNGGTVNTLGCGLINSDASSSTGSFPFYGYYNSSYAQQIVPVEKLEGVGDTIYAVSFLLNSNNATPSYHISMWMGNTSVSEFSSTYNTNDFIPHTSLTQVVSGEDKIIPSSGWVTFTLSTPFVRNTDSNLVYNELLHCRHVLQRNPLPLQHLRRTRLHHSLHLHRLHRRRKHLRQLASAGRRRLLHPLLHRGR